MRIVSELFFLRFEFIQYSPRLLSGEPLGLWFAVDAGWTPTMVPLADENFLRLAIPAEAAQKLA